MRDDQILQASRELAVAVARGDSTKLLKRRKLVDLLTIFVGIMAAVTGAYFDHLLPFDKKTLSESPLMLVGFVAVGLITLAATFSVVVLQKTLRDAELLVPADMYLSLAAQTEESARLDRTAQMLFAWVSLQHTLWQEAVAWERRVRDAITAITEDRIAADEAFRTVDRGFEEVLQHLMEGLKKKRDVLLGFRLADEVFFFDVFEVRGNEMHRIARACSTYHADGTPVVQHNRVWPIDGSHVGDCIFQNRVLCVNYDVQIRDRTNPLFRESDLQNFGCRLSAPIYCAEASLHQAYGVFCFTSSDPQRLSINDALYVENLAHQCAALFRRRRNLRAEVQQVRNDRMRAKGELVERRKPVMYA